MSIETRSKLKFLDTVHFSFLGALGRIKDPIKDGELVLILKEIEKCFNLPEEKREIHYLNYLSLRSRLEKHDSFIARNASRELYAGMPVYFD